MTCGWEEKFKKNRGWTIHRVDTIDYVMVFASPFFCASSQKLLWIPRHLWRGFF